MKLDIVTIMIAVVMVMFLLLYALIHGGRILRYYIFDRKGKLIYAVGEVVERVNERAFQRGKQRAMISIPKVKVKYKGEEYQVESMLYYPDVIIGEIVKVGVYDREKGEAEFWIVRDMKKAKMDFLKKLILMTIITITMTITMIFVSAIK